MDRFTARIASRETPFAECLRAWDCAGHNGLDTFVTTELEAHRSVALGLEESGNYPGAYTLTAFIRDLDEHLEDRWSATAVAS